MLYKDKATFSRNDIWGEASTACCAGFLFYWLLSDCTPQTVQIATRSLDWDVGSNRFSQRLNADVIVRQTGSLSQLHPYCCPPPLSFCHFVYSTFLSPKICIQFLATLSMNAGFLPMLPWWMELHQEFEASLHVLGSVDKWRAGLSLRRRECAE